MSETLADILESEQPKWRSCVGYILGSRQDADDCINDAAAKVMSRRPDLTGEPLRLYLQRAVRNRALDFAKRNSRALRRWAPLWILDGRQGPDPAPDLDPELFNTLNVKLSQLPADQFEALQALYLARPEGVSIREVAEEYGIPFSTLLHRSKVAIKTLRRMYRREALLTEAKPTKQTE